MFEQDKESGNNLSPAREKLWEHLKDKKLFNLPFQVEYPIDQICVDFYCDPLKMAIIIDGEVQELEGQPQYEAGKELGNQDIKIVHCGEKDIDFNIDEVIESIKWECALRHLELENK